MSFCAVGRKSTSGLAILAVCTLMLTGLVACKKSGSSSNEPSDAEKQAQSLYAKGYNSLLDDPKDMIKEFFERVPETGVPEKNKKVHMFGRHTLADSDIKEAEQAFSAAGDTLKKIAPIAGKLMDAIKQVHSIYRDAYNYFKAEDYKDDAGAKGKKLVADMKQAATAFQKNLNAMGDALSALEDKASLSEIAKFSEKKGPSYLFRNFNFKAKKVLDAGSNKERVMKQLAALKKAYEEIETWKKSNEASPAFKGYLGTVDNFHNNAKKLKRLLKTKDTDPRAGKRTYQALVNNYNTLVSISNSLYQVEDLGQL